jgi:dTDP-glucose 4,6-dehydratase
MSYHVTYGLPITISNCSNNYGPYQFPEKFIPLMIVNMSERKPLPIYGDGKNVRDWIYVEDHCSGVWRILQKGKAGEKYNLSGENEWENVRLVKEICKIYSSYTGIAENEILPLITYVKDRPGHDFRYAVDCAKIKNELGWTRKVEMKEGLRETIKWYLDNPQWVSHVKNGDYLKWIQRNYEDR